jgi:hypothetical protein
VRGEIVCCLRSADLDRVVRDPPRRLLAVAEYWVFARHLHVHRAELTPAYEMHFAEHGFAWRPGTGPRLTDKWEAIFAMDQEDIKYMHVRVVEKLPLVFAVRLPDAPKDKELERVLQEHIAVVHEHVEQLGAGMSLTYKVSDLDASHPVDSPFHTFVTDYGDP